MNNLVHGRPRGVRVFRGKLLRVPMMRDEAMWRASHADAVINAMVSVLAFVHVAERAKNHMVRAAAGECLDWRGYSLGQLLMVDLGKDGVQES